MTSATCRKTAISVGCRGPYRIGTVNVEIDRKKLYLSDVHDPSKSIVVYKSELNEFVTRILELRDWDAARRRLDGPHR